jgi:hypothetical protein
MKGGGEDLDSQQNTLGGPAGAHTSQLGLIVVSRASNKTGSFCTIILWLGKTIKPFFSIPDDTASHVNFKKSMHPSLLVHR